MIRIDRWDLRIPGESERDARALVAEIRRLLAERVPEEASDLRLGRLDVRLDIDTDAEPADIADAIVTQIVGALDSEVRR